MEFTTLSQAISNIKDGSLITFSGMELNRAPMALIYEIVRQGKKGLKTISIPNPLATDVLIKAGCVKHATFGFNGFSFEDGFVIAPNWRRAVENESIQWKETDPIEIVMGLKASSLGIKEIEVPGFKNTDYLKFNKYKRVIKNDEKVILANAITPDFALIHAQYADKGGNVFIEDPLIDNLIANASKNIIVSVEKIVKKLDKITIRSEKINCIIKAERGAWPTSCFKFYDYDAKKIRSYIGKDKNLSKKTENNDHKHIDSMVLALSGFIKEGEIFATGVASPLPMIAAMFAKKTGKKFDYFNCGSGAVNPVIMEPAYSSVTINALEEKESFIEFLEVLDYASKGKIGLMFFGAVQISSNGDVNMTCIGNYRKPKVKLPGPAAAVTLRNLIKESILITQHHTKKTFVEKVDFVTSSTEKDTLVVTNLGVLRLGKKQEILTFFPHSSIEEIKSNTGFKLEDKFAKKSKAISEKDIEILNQIDPEGIRYRIS